MIEIGDLVRVKSAVGNELRSMSFDEEYCQQIQDEYSDTIHKVNYIWTDQNKQLFVTIDTGVKVPVQCIVVEKN